MPETLLTALKASAMAAVMQTFGLYAGAILIAFIAAMARLAYSYERASVNTFVRFFVMSLSVAMLMVHVGELRGWTTPEVIVISGPAAFLSQEMLETLLASRKALLEKVWRRFKP